MNSARWPISIGLLGGSLGPQRAPAPSRLPHGAYFVKKPLKIQIVELARALIADAQHWCPRHLALDKNDVVVSPTSSLAVKRCALGAVLAAAYQLTHDLDAAYKLGHEALAP